MIRSAGTLPLLALVLTPLLALPARGQTDERLILPLDPDAHDALARLEELGQRGQWDRVVLGLDELLRRGGDRLIRTDTGFTTVRAEARRRLRALAGRGRDAYRLVHEPRAQALFEAALTTADVTPLERLVAEHPASAGWVARARTLLVGRHVEAGRPEAALVHLDSLLADPHAALGTLDGWRRQRVVALALAGRVSEARAALGEPVPAAWTDLAAWIESVAPRPPEVPLAPHVLSWAREVVGYYEHGDAASPWSQVRCDGAAAYAHDASHAYAVALATGKVLWRTPLRGVDAFRRPEGPCRLALGPGRVVCALPGNAGAVGLERESGRLLWRRSLDDLKREGEVDFPAALVGAPCVIGDVAALLLVTEHEERAVHLLGVGLDDGRVRWSAFLASDAIGADPRPALVAAGGRALVVTGLGTVTAVDAHGEVLWVRTYRSARDEVARSRGRWGGRVFTGGPREAAPQGGPGCTALVARGLLWVAPADGDGVLIYDPERGEPRGGIRHRGVQLVGVARLERQEEVVAIDASGVALLLGRGSARACGAEPIGLPVASPAVVGDRLYVPRREGVFELELASGHQRRVGGWSGSLGVGHLEVAGRRLLVASPRGLFGFGVAPAPAPELSEARLIAALGDPSWTVRKAASEALQGRGEAARAQLELAARSADTEVALRAHELLGELERVERLNRWRPLIKPEWRAAVTDLLNRLTHPNAEVRLEALTALAGLTDPDALTLVRDLLADRDPRVAFTAAAALLERGDREGVARIHHTLAHGVAPDRLRAAHLLQERGTAEDLPPLVAALADPETDVRAAAVTGVLRLGKDAALEQVRAMLQDDQERVRMAVLEGLQHLTSDAAVELLAAAAADPNDAIRARAVASLVEVRTPAAYRALAGVLADPVRETARAAAQALYRVVQGPDALAIPAEALEAGAAQRDPTYRNYVAQITMRFVGRGGVVSVKTLIRFMSDAEEQIRGYYLRREGARLGWSALLQEQVARVGCSEAEVAALVEAGLHERADVRTAAYAALAQTSGPGRGAALVQGLGDAEAAVRELASTALLADPLLLDPPAVRALLQTVLSAERAEAKQAAASVLDRAPREQAVAGLLPLLRSDDAPLRVAAGERLHALAAGAVAWSAEAPADAAADAFALWWWRERHPGRTPEAVLAALDDPNPSHRWRAAQEAAGLPLPEVGRALARSTLGERLPWVLSEKLKALVAVVGEPLGFADGLDAAGLEACAARFRERLGVTEGGK